MASSPSYQLLERLAEVKSRLERACHKAGRSVDEVKLMAVTKTQPAEVVANAVAQGLWLLGENRVQEAVAKMPQVPPLARWELIGHLQSNKAKVAATSFHRVQTVDRPSLVAALAQARSQAGLPPLPILLQVNAGQDPAKFGVAPEEAPALLEAALASPSLQVEGLMTIAPLAEDPEVARRCFENLRRIRDELQDRFALALPELSMGMSGDMETAIAAGSTLVRVGSALFGERIYAVKEG